MRLFNPKLKDVIEIRKVTYHENVMVRNGFCEVENIYSIAELKRRGFIEVAEPTVISKEEISENVLKTDLPSKEKETIKSKKVPKSGKKSKKSGVKI